MLKEDPQYLNCDYPKGGEHWNCISVHTQRNEFDPQHLNKQFRRAASYKIQVIPAIRLKYNGKMLKPCVRKLGKNSHKKEHYILQSKASALE